MKRKTAGRVNHQRECAYCHGGIAETRPVFLVTLPDGWIVGPYHAGCASKVAAEYKRSEDGVAKELQRAEKFGQMWQQETLPW